MFGKKKKKKKKKRRNQQTELQRERAANCAGRIQGLYRLNLTIFTRARHGSLS
jgi:hypothetical protein